MTDSPKTGPRGATGALIELDRELMKLLVRRATLVSRIRGGRDHAATPAAIQAEKAVRIAWETGALAFSKDPRFSRQLFNLLQEVKVLSKEQAEKSGSFRLSPPARPLSGRITGPTSTRMAQMRLTLSACLGKKLRLNPVLFSHALNDTFKACVQAGATLTRHGEGKGLSAVTVAEGAPFSLSNKSLYLGEDPFTLYLMAFFAVGRPGVCRLSGGARLKTADLSALRHSLPLFGARLAHTVPHSQGLPAQLECSGELPPHVLVPADLPGEAVSALLLAALSWGAPITLDLAALPAATAMEALTEMRPLYLDCNADVETHGPRLVYNAGVSALPENISLPLDPALCAYLLALPAFAGGSLNLTGVWPSHIPEAMQAEQLLHWAGLNFRREDDAVFVERHSKAAFRIPLQSGDISPKLGPLFLVLAALCHSRTGSVPALQTLLPYPSDDTEQALAQEFFSRLGFVYEQGALEAFADKDKAQREPAADPSWTSPDAFWSMAFALGACLRPGLQLANPGNVSEVMPSFWSIYNSLPNPVDPALSPQKKQENNEHAKPARRRILTD